MAESQRSVELPCYNCENTRYTVSFKVVRHPNGGTARTEEHARCDVCGTLANWGAAWNKVRIEERRRQLEQMEETARAELAGLLEDERLTGPPEEGEAGLAHELAQNPDVPEDLSQTSLGKLLEVESTTESDS